MIAVAAIPVAWRGQNQRPAKTNLTNLPHTVRATTVPRVCVGGAARVSKRLARVGGYARGHLDSSTNANGARARRRRPTVVFATPSVSGSENPEGSSSTSLDGRSTPQKHPPASHTVRRLVLALVVFALVTLVFAQGSVRASARDSMFSAFSSIAIPVLPRNMFWIPEELPNIVVDLKPALTIALMTCLSITPVPTRKASRVAFNALARLLAANGAHAWVTAACALSGPYVGRAVRLCVTWALFNHVVRLPIFDPSTVLSTPPVVRELLGTLSSVFGQGAGHALQQLTICETQGWCFVTSTRALAAALCVLCAKWVMHAKRPPPKPADVVTDDHDKDAADTTKGDSSADPVAQHFAALRGDDGVSWDRQARSVLVDAALSSLVTVASVLAVANALRVNITGLLAVGGFSGVAFGFAAQRCVANFISGVLIFVTQPFKQGDLVATAHGTGEGAFRGVVRQVGWHSTSLESSRDGSVLIVPNSELSTAAVRNLSRTERVCVVELVPITVPVEVQGKDINGATRAAVFAANKVVRTHPGVCRDTEKKEQDTLVDGAVNPRCVLVSDAVSGAVSIKCAYVMRKDVPRHSTEAVRSAVLVKLREAVAAALSPSAPKVLRWKPPKVENASDHFGEGVRVRMLRQIIEQDFPDIAPRVAESIRRGERRYEGTPREYEEGEGKRGDDVA